MATIWISDFRGRQLKYYQELEYDETEDNKKSDDKGDENAPVFIIDDLAEYTWFKNSATVKLGNVLEEDSSVIIMLGFNDCVYSCAWGYNYNINTIGSQYVSAINELISQYSSNKFYVCAVPPIDGNYPFSEHSDGRITKSNLNSKIQKFNKKIKKSKATFIDTYQYLTSTSFSTRDGVRFVQKTCESLLQYINDNVAEVSTSSAFVARTKAPKVDADNPEQDPYWLGENCGGLNPFYGLGQDYSKGKGDTLPNCTAYAWGRFYEILGSEPKLSTGNAEQWYLNKSDGYERGDTPKVGAVICWKKGSSTDPTVDDGAGHVAIVEKVNDDGSIKTSESGFSEPSYWWESDRTKGRGNWGASSDYTFQGFIYNPAVTPGGITENVSLSEVVSRDSSLTKAEMKINARYIWNYLGTKGWSLNAVAGMLGNMQHESAINPGRNEIGGTGYGLVQWTPKSKLTNWLKEKNLKDNMDGQLERIIWEKDTGKQYYKNHYKYTFKEYAVSLDDPYDLACAFAFDYERSGVVIWGFHTNEYSPCDKAASKCKNSCVRSKECYKRKFGTAATNSRAEVNREALRKKRGGSAREWYSFLAPYAPGFTKSFMANNLKIDSLTYDKATVSIVVRSCRKAKYELQNSSGEKIKSETISSVTSSNTENMMVVSLKLKSLSPNTEYKLIITATSSDSSKEKKKNTLIFKTPQSYPTSPSNIKLIAKDGILLQESLQLSAEPTSDWGHWKKNSHGYLLQLFVNGKIVQEVSKNANYLASTKTFKLENEFSKFDYSVGDTIQVGIRSWVENSKGKKLYDSTDAITSNTISLIDKPISAYLNID